MSLLLANRALIRPVSTANIITDGLQFWGRSDPALLTEVSGKITEAYDIRDGYGGARKMIQTDAARQPIILDSSLYFDSSNKYMIKTGQAANTMFIVIKVLGGSTPFGIGLIQAGTSPNTNSLNTNSSNANYKVGTDKDFYFNNVKYSAPTPHGVNYNIYHTAYDYGKTSSTLALGYLFSFGGGGVGYIREWGWYNRVLTDEECLINIAALNAMYATY